MYQSNNNRWCCCQEFYGTPWHIKNELLLTLIGRFGFEGYGEAIAHAPALSVSGWVWFWVSGWTVWDWNCKMKSQDLPPSRLRGRLLLRLAANCRYNRHGARWAQCKVKRRQTPLPVRQPVLRGHNPQCRIWW